MFLHPGESRRHGAPLHRFELPEIPLDSGFHRRKAGLNVFLLLSLLLLQFSFELLVEILIECLVLSRLNLFLDLVHLCSRETWGVRLVLPLEELY